MLDVCGYICVLPLILTNVLYIYMYICVPTSSVHTFVLYYSVK